MVTAAIAFSEIERTRPELIEKLGLLFLKHPPPLPAGYWEKLQSTSERQLTLAGYRIADLIIAAANQIEAQRKFVWY